MPAGGALLFWGRRRGYASCQINIAYPARAALPVLIPFSRVNVVRYYGRPFGRVNLPRSAHTASTAAPGVYWRCALGLGSLL